MKVKLNPNIFHPYILYTLYFPFFYGTLLYHGSQSGDAETDNFHFNQFAQCQLREIYCS